ncbi:MAG: PilZ domain-containing protein [Phycisphaerae bacterium]|nr:PilZ domain-containing protein [Phycisphaerae bacterium]
MSLLRHNPFAHAIERDLPLERRWATSRFEEKREFERHHIVTDVWLLDLEGLTVLRCQTDDIGQGGLHATVPIGFGLAVGQRYELRLRSHADGAPTPRGAGWSACYGTIIRTRLLTSGDQHRLGFAMRFDSPQHVIVH